MRLTLFIGPTEQAAARLRALFKAHEEPLGLLGIHAPDWNHVRLYAACADPEAVGILRFRRGLDGPLIQPMLWDEFSALIARDVKDTQADHFVVAAAQLGNLLHRPAELARLKALLSPHFDDIRIVAHVGDQARALLHHYTYAVMEGRCTGLERDLALTDRDGRWHAALAARDPAEPHFGLLPDIQAPPFWLDYAALLAFWEDAFGAAGVTLRALDTDHLASTKGGAELAGALDLEKPLPASPQGPLSTPEPAANLTRMRAFNDVLIRYCRLHDLSCPRDLWSQMLASLRIEGPPVDPDSLAAIRAYFARDNAALCARFADIAPALPTDASAVQWHEADPGFGFRATQYLAAYNWTIRKRSSPMAEVHAAQAEAQKAEAKFDDMLDHTGAKAQLARVKVNHRMILSSPFRPHNRMGAVNEEELGAAYAPAPPRDLPPGNSGNVIVGCMKNEAPYIVEWVAYHRAIGVDNFLIYTNGCDDQTDDILQRLQAMGVIEHRSNENWKGNSPQQHALNQSLKEPLIRNAAWIAHIDVDEFINIRTGNGTLADLFAAVPDATNFAMTWRLFGHNGVRDIADTLVIDQFDSCAPKFCPKPHTVWGYKTLFRNIGAYGKISCHRPNKLDAELENKVKWVNGSGRDMTRDAVKNGWRSSKSNIGYDLLQLNHYALRSADSFLIKRQRGRALHVDRSIGLNYWIRMDWSDYRDITIKRNIPRLQAEMDRLLADPTLRHHHEAGLAWHRARAEALRNEPEFKELYTQALAIKLNETERVAFALALDMET